MSFLSSLFPRQADPEPASAIDSGPETYPESDASDGPVNSKSALTEKVRDQLASVVPDIGFVEERANETEASRAHEAVQRNSLYKTWLKSSNSEKLLVYYEPENDDDPNGVTALSALCLRVRADFLNQEEKKTKGQTSRKEKNLHGKNIVLLWFSSQHKHEDEYKTRGKRARAMLGSLTSQLIAECRHRDISMQGLEKYTDRAVTRHTDNRLELFKMLVRQIPSDYGLACIIDDVCYFDQPELRDGACKVFECLFSLNNDRLVKAKVNMFFTSRSKPTLVYDYFQKPDRTIVWDDL
ncbi:unnamed protein product [Clonostachys rosea]|uniref:Uncharacterized protein n=1 Tax=Bionectria ochroleuca TaxID=29856 RepID=A0ABY6TYI3_BIOOC|nr:unnamed protein product [Clonostachys rosea]